MSSPQRRSSCLGLFFKAWAVCGFALALLVTAAVGLGIRWMGWDAAAWTTVTAWNSHCVVAGAGVLLASGALALLVTLSMSAVTALLSQGRGGERTASRSKRPQAQRKTTV